MIIGEKPQQKGEAWEKERFETAQVTDSARILNNLDEAKLKGMILKMREELFQTGKLTEFKRVLASVMVESMVKILGNEEILEENQTHRKNSEESTKSV